MNSVRIKHLARSSGALSPQDSIGKAAELLRLSSFTIAPVVESGRIVGLLSERDLTAALHNGSQRDPYGHETRDGNGAAPIAVGSVMKDWSEAIADSASVVDVAEKFEATEHDALPVVDAYGRLTGMVRRSDVVAAICGALRPPVVGGMATPLGVLLTTGHLRGGTSNFALALTGAFMAASLIAVQWGLRLLIYWLTYYTSLGRFAPDLSLAIGSWQIAEFQGQGTLEVAHSVLQILFFLTIIRFTPLAGYHGAEHKVVHAIERGEDLTPEKVRLMPRPHPRCGTNLVIFLVIVAGLWGYVDSGIALILGVLGWKVFGMKVQQVFTTKEPTDRQLLAGIAAGKQLLERYNAMPAYRATFFGRLLNMGFPQILSGMLLVFIAQFALLNWMQRALLGD